MSVCRIHPAQGPTLVPSTLPDLRPILNSAQQFHCLGDPCTRLTSAVQCRLLLAWSQCGSPSRLAAQPFGNASAVVSQRSARRARLDPRNRQPSALFGTDSPLRHADSQTWITESGESVDNSPAHSGLCSARMPQQSPQIRPNRPGAPRHQ